MSIKRLINNIKLSVIPAIVLLVPVFVGCQQDNFYDHGKEYYGEPMLEFRASVSDNLEVTRDLTQTPVNVEPNEFDGYFYIQVNNPKYKQDDGTEVNASKYGEYKVPINGNGGVLEYAGQDRNKKPNWYTIDDDHYFWSWTIPWAEAAAEKGVKIEYWGTDIDDNGMVIDHTRDGEETGEGDNKGNGNENGEGGNGENLEEPEVPEIPSYDPVDPLIYLNTRPIRIRLQNTHADEFHYVDKEEEKDSSWMAGSWGNGYFFEKFIGAKSGPYDFRRNGVEVPLQFRHLMSKISVRSLLFYKADGTTEEDYKADITFINMPTEFTFYPHPDHDGKPGQDDQYMRKDGPPIVVTNQSSANPNGGIMFGFTNPIDLLVDEHPDDKVQYRDKFYICPEVDFSKVSFKVEFVGGAHMDRGEYYGDFSSVAFEREPGTDYDNDYVKDEEGKLLDDSKVLHAGETMYFDLIVREYGGGGYTIYVRNWSTRPEQKTKHYPHPGIYVDGEAAELIGTSQSADAKFDLYGDGFWDGEREPDKPELPNHLGLYHLYNDLDMGNRTAFPLDKEYVFNGMGHILKFSPSSDTKTVTIGKMIDVYIEINGYTIYIDPEGYICVYNKDTRKYERTEPEQYIDIHGSKNSFTLDVENGILK